MQLEKTPWIHSFYIFLKVTHDHHNNQKWNLHIVETQLEDAGPYMCQLNTEPMKSQVEQELFSPAFYEQLRCADM